MKGLTIGQIAKQANVTPDTIRLYERYGLLDTPSRSMSGYRQYPEASVIHLRFILRAKAIGFTLKEIGEILALRKTSIHTCDDVRKKAEIKHQQILGKLDELRKLEVALRTLIDTCETHDPNDLCPIITALEQADKTQGSK